MSNHKTRPKHLFSIVIPCYNEKKTLRHCIDRVLQIEDDHLDLEILIVDDGSVDGSLHLARDLEARHEGIRVLAHERNLGKGAALRTGFKQARGDFVAIQDADLEYDPMELKQLLKPLIAGEADVVMGSRFLTAGAHRVLYFWHSLGNRFLTFLSNMFTDLNLSDMEACYKVFRREVLQRIDIEENRFGIEPEIVAKVAQMRVRVFEMGVSYHGRTYAEGKKIGVGDGFRALYCILHYNTHCAPWPLQVCVFSMLWGGVAALNLALFLILRSSGVDMIPAVAVAFCLSAAVCYLLSINLVFRQGVKWNRPLEILFYVLVVVMGILLDAMVTLAVIEAGHPPAGAKIAASTVGLFLCFCGCRWLVFPEPSSGPWQSQKTFSDRD